MYAMWVIHGMMHVCNVDDTWHDACMPCGYVQPIKRGLVEENKWRKRRKGERKRERKEDPTGSSSNLWRFDGRSSSGRELKSIYSTRVTLQEVEIFLLLLIAFLFGPVFKGTGWGLFSGLFRTDFSVVWTEKSRLMEDLVSRVLASGCSLIQGCLRLSWKLLCG